LQAKQDPDKSAFISGFATGGAYLCSVILLALPYFLIRSMIPAFVISTSVGIALIALFTFYGVVVFENRKFWREFLEATGLMLATAVATFVWGLIIGKVFHVNTGNF
jgi:VIT1/CCC1 family predicted Fe2+/Mn2+ transporter